MTPCVSLFLWAKKRTVGLKTYNPSKEDERCTKEILLLEEELFVENDRAVHWPVIQLYRNLFVAVLNTFMLNDIFRSMALLPVFMIFGLHDALINTNI